MFRVLLSLAICCAAFAEDESTVVDPTTRLVQDLGSDEFEVRERAQAALIDLGRRSAPAVWDAYMHDPDPEVKERAGVILERHADSLWHVEEGPWKIVVPWSPPATLPAMTLTVVVNVDDGTNDTAGEDTRRRIRIETCLNPVVADVLERCCVCVWHVRGGKRKDVAERPPLIFIGKQSEGLEFGIRGFITPEQLRRALVFAVSMRASSSTGNGPPLHLSLVRAAITGDPHGGCEEGGLQMVEHFTWSEDGDMNSVGWVPSE